MSSRDDRRVRIFVSHGVSDPIDTLVEDLRHQGFDVTSTEQARGPMPWRQAVVDLIRSSDVVVVLVDRASADVLIDVGAALGASKPVITVTTDLGPPPQEVADLPTMEATLGMSTLGTAIRRLAMAERYEVEWGRETGPALSADQADQLLNAISETLDAETFQALVLELFRSAGAQVVSPQREPTDTSPLARPDLVVWHDELLAGFGLPLPVEVLVRTFTPEAVISRLRRTLEFSGARSLLAVTQIHSEPVHWIAEDGRFILVTPVRALVKTLANLSLADALATIRTQAELSGVSG